MRTRAIYATKTILVGAIIFGLIVFYLCWAAGQVQT
jgi:hypothetical protein